jgi:hypothetical protein
MLSGIWKWKNPVNKTLKNSKLFLNLISNGFSSENHIFLRQV